MTEVSNLPRLHVGLTVWPTRSDLFYSLRDWVDRHAPGEVYVPLNLTPSMYDLIVRTEYSPRKRMRVFYYRKVARYLEREIACLMREAQGRYREVVLYTPDDGYWAELLHVIRRRVGGGLRLLNIQHGQAGLVLFPQRMRRLLNRLCVMFTGHPNFGYGFGAGTLDGYVVMSSHERDYIQNNFGTPAYVAPAFIRGDFFARAKELSAQAPAPGGKLRILFATSPIFGSVSNVNGARDKAEAGFLADIADMLRAVMAAVPCEISFRFHPGQDRAAAEAAYRAAGLNEISAIDEHHGILESLLASDFAIAYASTVLLEAELLGKVPVDFHPRNYPPVWSVTVQHETLEFWRDSAGRPHIYTERGSLAQLFSPLVTSLYSAQLQKWDYDLPLPWL